MKKWYLKGRTGEMLASLREEGPHPFTATLLRSAVFLRDGDGMTWISVTVRGNAHDRRKTARALQRWLNEGAAHVAKEADNDWDQAIAEGREPTLADKDDWALKNDGGNYYRGT